MVTSIRSPNTQDSVNFLCHVPSWSTLSLKHERSAVSSFTVLQQFTENLPALHAQRGALVSQMFRDGTASSKSWEPERWAPA